MARLCFWIRHRKCNVYIYIYIHRWLKKQIAYRFLRIHILLCGKNGYCVVTVITLVLGSLRSATGWRCDKLPPASQRSNKRRRPGSEAMSRRRFRKFPLASADPRTDFTQLECTFGFMLIPRWDLFWDLDSHSDSHS